MTTLKDRRGNEVETKETQDKPEKSEQDSLKKRVAEIRAARAKLRGTSSNTRNVLAYKKIPGFRTRVVSDKSDRISQFKERGWEHVYGDETGGELTARDPQKVGAAVSKVVGSDKNGKVTGYLMKIPEEIYDEDKKRKQEEITLAEQRMVQINENLGYNKTKFGK